MSDDPRDAPFFIVGSARSGTTLLRDLLRSHSRLFVGTEARFIPFLHALHGSPQNDREAIRLGTAILDTIGHSEVWTTLTPDDFAHFRSFRAAASLPFERAAAAAGKARWGDKSPRYVEHIPQILEIFPAARVVHIVRDGRDVALSMMRTNFAPQTVYHAATAWRRRVLRGREALRCHGPQRIHEVRYEELLRDPKATLSELLGFLGEEFEPPVLTRSRISSEGGPHRSGSDQVDPTRAGRWTQEMSLRDRCVFESVAEDALRAFGYPVEGLGRPISTLSRWRWHLIESRRRLASGWLVRRLRLHWLRVWWMRRRARSKGVS